jgi:hypothetical protein
MNDVDIKSFPPQALFVPFDGIGSVARNESHVTNSLKTGLIDGARVSPILGTS